MNYDSVWYKLIVLVCSILFTGIVIGLFLVDATDWDANKIVGCVLCSIWGFFLFPAIRYVMNWFKRIHSFEEGINAGFRIGYYGIGYLIIMIPIVGIIYYLNKRFISKRMGGKNIYIVGWYIELYG